MTVKVDAVRRSSVLELMPVAHMENVGGLNLLKDWIAQRKSAFTPEAKEAGVDRPKGIMLCGSPGGGKSLAAKAVAHELGQPLIKFDISRVYGSLVGQSEQKVREALKTIEACAPVTCLIDEIDKAVSLNSNTNDGGVSTRVLGSILTFMQESQAEVFWVMTANRTTNLPSELVRKGRLDEVFSVLMPSEEERLEILRIHLRKRNEDPDTISNLAIAVERSAGFVGAELEQAVKDAKLHAFHFGVDLTGELIAEQFGKTKPLSVAFAEDFAAMEQWASNNARPASDKSHSVGAVARTRTRTGQRQMPETAAPSSLDS